MAVIPIARNPDEMYAVIMSEIQRQFVRDPTVLESPQAKRVLHAIKRGLDIGYGYIVLSADEE